MDEVGGRGCSNYHLLGNFGQQLTGQGLGVGEAAEGHKLHNVARRKLARDRVPQVALLREGNERKKEGKKERKEERRKEGKQ